MLHFYAWISRGYVTDAWFRRMYWNDVFYTIPSGVGSVFTHSRHVFVVWYKNHRQKKTPTYREHQVWPLQNVGIPSHFRHCFHIEWKKPDTIEKLNHSNAFELGITSVTQGPTPTPIQRQVTSSWILADGGERGDWFVGYWACMPTNQTTLILLLCSTFISASVRPVNTIKLLPSWKFQHYKSIYACTQ